MTPSTRRVETNRYSPGTSRYSPSGTRYTTPSTSPQRDPSSATYRGYARHAIERGTPDRLADRERDGRGSATAPTRGYADRVRDRDATNSPGSATRRTNAGLGTTGFGKKREGSPSDDALRFIGSADRGPSGGASGIRGTGGGSVTGGGSLAGRPDAGIERKPRTLKPAPNAKSRGLSAGSGLDRSFTPSGVKADRSATRGKGSGLGTTADLDRSSAGLGHDYTHRKKHENNGRHGEKYGGDYYEKNHHGKHHHHGRGYYPYYPYYYGYYDCWPYGYYGYPSFGFGYYGSWYFGLSWCWPFYYSYGSYWPYSYSYGYPFHRVYHYGYTSYCPDRVVVYENYYENYYEGGGGVVYEDGVPAESGAAPAATAPAELPEDPLVTGDVLLRAGRYDEAVEAYRKVVEDEPDNSVAKFALADALFAEGKYNESTYTLRLGLMQDPEWLDASVNKGDIFPSGEEFERLLGELEAYANERPFDSSAWYLLGFQQYFHNRFDAAETSLRRADEVLPGDALTGRTIEKVAVRRAAFEVATPDPERESATAPPKRDAAAAPAAASEPKSEASAAAPERKDLEEE